MLAILAAIAEYPERLVRIFNTRVVGEKGVFSVTIFNLGKPFEIIIDSYFPYSTATSGLIFAKPNRNELWVIILEKC